MGIMDGFRFFIGKTLAYLFLCFGFVLAYILVIMLIGYFEGRKK